MIKKNILVFILTVIVSLFSAGNVVAAEGDTLWAKSVVTAPSQTSFAKVATDQSGNIYAVGYMRGWQQFNFGNGVTITPQSGSRDLVLVKYNSDGVAQWARSTTVAPSISNFQDVYVSSGGIYVTGYIDGSGVYELGNGVSVNGAYASGKNGVIVKYNSDGDAQWAKSISASTNESVFYSVTVDSLGMPSVAGYINGSAQFGFGNSITATGGGSSTNFVLVKYDSGGVAQWARSTTTGNGSIFMSLSSDSSNNIYTAGSITSNAFFSFGNGVFVAGRHPTNSNAVIVKYNSDGDAQWARSTSVSAFSTSSFNDIVSDSAGNTYLAGQAYGQGTYGLGDGFSFTTLFASGYNPFIIKYDSAGVTQWTKTTEGGSSQSTFYSIGLGSSNGIYVSGDINGSSTYNFGNSVTVAGDIYHNVLVLKYNLSGEAQWAKTNILGPNEAAFEGIALNSSDDVIAVGNIYTSGSFDFGNSVSVSGAHSQENIVVVKYSGPPAPTPTPTPSSSSNVSSSNAAENTSGARICSDAAPTSAPDLFQVDVTGSTAKLFFTPLSNTNSYFVSYSTKPIAEEHGAQVTLAKEGVQSFTLNLLNPGTPYYLKVRGQNGCMPGVWSNTVKVTTRPKGLIKPFHFYKTSPSAISSRTAKPSELRSSIPTTTVIPVPMSTSTPTAEPAPSMSDTKPSPKTCLLWWCW